MLQTETKYLLVAFCTSTNAKLIAMFKVFLLLLLVPAVAKAQELKPAEPILSADYRQLIAPAIKQPIPNIVANTIYSFNHSPIKVQSDYNLYGLIRKITISNNLFKIKNSHQLTFSLGGNYNVTTEIKTVNRQPALQNQFAQGRPINGALAWQGAETNELFSYGPSLSALSFDGSNYPYDINGRLTTNVDGNKRHAAAYNNSIFRTASLLKQSFTLQGNLLADYNQKFSFTVQAGKAKEAIFISHNQNESNNINVTATVSPVRNFTITATHRYNEERLSNSNRNGFLNRVNQTATLTPASFSNAQGSTTGGIQRSYSRLSDNPIFLLDESGNHSFKTQQNTALSIERQVRRFSIKLFSSFEKTQQKTVESYKTGTAYFSDGVGTNRTATNNSFLFKTNTRYNIKYGSGEFLSVVTANYILTKNKATINYSQPATLFDYQRNSQDFYLNFSSTFNSWPVESGIDVSNKAYVSNTITKKFFFLPGVSAFTRWRADNNDFSIKVAANFIQFVSEPAINQSYGYYNLTQYNTAQWQQYFPVTEVASFSGLAAVRHRERSALLEVWYKRISFNAMYFAKETSGDVFPVYQNGTLQLKNAADHRAKGIELQLRQMRWGYLKNGFATTNEITFTTFTDKVTAVADGFNGLPTAGFSNVHEAIIKDEVLGSIVGNGWQRDGNSNILIGSDGFPLVAVNNKVIGNPTPDFIVKVNNNLLWKNLSLSLDWEWRKGGDVWNGTQAMLDYYGRSQQSANLRNTSNYVFKGVLQNGLANTTPVDFYNPALPFESSRWVRYGSTGVAEDYIEKADQLRINTLAVTYKVNFKKYIKQAKLTAYVNNILVWSPYKGVDPNQLLYDQPATTGLDFFNLPSTRSFGVNLNIQF